MELHQASVQWVYEAKNLQETEQLAAYFAGQAKPGTVIALDGDLGAGKTAFSQLFAKHLGVQGTVNSPTFTLIKEYEGRVPFYHMDVYRLTLEEAEDLGLDEYFYGDGVTLVEWASIIVDILPKEVLHIYIEAGAGTERKMVLTGRGEPYESWITTLKRNGVGLE
ncbi:tRNA (adenosine(37)-N6)-threonylcarbamoyltransferase complex ATPase subunit type 1 TsaE [Paenibacillus fonticola]|uniref:tRNA (adenosine(37)-N6)-threonylcarbamoyltransferase complex ATPase subunit type 1 TsaE n=1 Tax=Paenibacillus fonticola TaxID=379896 RepID=UPI00037657A8|nr:tRNA (adenosine(37)-N6)-threonylcarbamoyltransferase complex ATPase subunit type 1 TsaE [Paenibacillus fonticola]